MNNVQNKSLGFNIEIPSDVMSEQSLIASVLLGGKRLFKNLSHIDKGMFYRVSHSLIWEAYTAIDASGQDIDIVTVNEELTRRNALEACGGLGYIMQCAELLPTTSNYESYVKLVIAVVKSFFHQSWQVRKHLIAIPILTKLLLI